MILHGGKGDAAGLAKQLRWEGKMSFAVYSFWTRKLLKLFLMVAVSLGANRSVEAGQNVMLTWNPGTNSNVAGYHIYYGGQSHVYTNMIPVPNVTQTILTNLSPGATYYFSATSHDSSTNESDYSAETFFTVPKPVVISNLPPTIKALANITINRNGGSQIINLTGITPGTTNGNPIKVTAVSSNPNLIVPTMSYLSPKATGTLTFKPSLNSTGTAVITVTVDNGGTQNNSVSKAFTVTVVTPVTKAMIAAVPRIYRQPESATVSTGKKAILTVGVSGKAPFNYQWQFNGANLPGATGPFLFLENITPAQAGLYSVQISNSYGSTNSATATLTVPGGPAVTLASVRTSLSSPVVNPAANLTMMSPPGSGQFSFQVNGISGSNYVVEASSDLVTWTAVSTNQSPFVYIDTNFHESAQRYYRAFYLP